jgi:hypothetical protein
MAIALSNAKKETVAQAIYDYIAIIYRPPQELLSDNGANLIGKIIKHYLKLLVIVVAELQGGEAWGR